MGVHTGGLNVLLTIVKKAQVQMAEVEDFKSSWQRAPDSVGAE